MAVGMMMFAKGIFPFNFVKTSSLNLKSLYPAAKNIFSAGSSENMPETSLSDEDFVDGKVDLIGILVKAGLVKSRSEGRRAIEQGGVVVNDEKIVDVYASYTKDAFGADFIVRRGKKNFRKITL